MAEIDIKIEDDLLIVTVTGNLSSDEIISVVKEYYPTGKIKNAIWDMLEGSAVTIKQQGFRDIAKAAKKSTANGFRQGGKTVYVGSKSVEYGICRMYTAIAEMTGVSVEYNVFRTLDEARAWLR